MTAPRGPWLFSRSVDLAVFLGSAVSSLLLVALGATLGVLEADTPVPLWFIAVVFVDVAHVWSTGFITYADGNERRAHPWRHALVPVVGYVLGVALYSEGELLFWRALAYVAVFHFVRQQWGWVARYRAAAGETTGRGLDAFAVYAATLYPLWHWHLTLPKRFQWFMQGDFITWAGLSEAARTALDRVGFGVWCVALGLYAVRAAIAPAASPGKHIVVASTAVCWYVGIVSVDGDYAFTVTNVLIHGIPYFAIVYQAMLRRRSERVAAGEPAGWQPRLMLFLGVLWLIALVEETLWDKAVWHEPEHRALFGAAWEVGDWKLLIVPALALPQLVHYVLDGFIWRRARQATPPAA